MKHRYKLPTNMEYKRTLHIINSIKMFYPTLFSEKEIELALEELKGDEDA